jgi:RNA polymerase sigma factor (sigma-70 family)
MSNAVADDYDREIAEWQRIVARHTDDFTRWFAGCEIVLKHTLRSFADTVDVEAVVQETALKVWQHAAAITPDGRPAFLFRWARTVALNAARTGARRATHPAAGRRADDGRSNRRSDKLEEMKDKDDHNQRVDPFLQARIKRCVEQLPPEQRRVLQARIDDEGRRADRELAAALGITFDRIRQNLSRARKALVTCLRSFSIEIREYVR